MRTIKFRAWDVRTGSWIAPTDFVIEPDTGKVLTSGTGMGYESLHGTKVILVQFTGLTDKNGIELYEGDLMLTDRVYHDYEDGVAINALPDGEIVKVFSKDGGFFAGDEFLCEIAQDWEKVGSIHENKELLDQPQQ